MPGKLPILAPMAQNGTSLVRGDPGWVRAMVRRRRKERLPTMTGPRSIDLYHVLVPLKKPIKHASYERSSSDNFVVRVTLGDGTVGYGEGVPRSYVTGETIATSFDSLA